VEEINLSQLVGFSFLFMDDLVINEQIHARTVRLLNDGQDTHVVSIYDALATARRSGLDLVIVAHGDPPVCRMLDAARFRYERKRSERESAKRQRALTITTKEIQLRPVTDHNDLLIKARRAKGFLCEGDRVKVIVRFRGRERSHREYGRAMIDRFVSEVGDHRIERQVSDGDSDTTIILASVISKIDLMKSR
jgi:translation initiation factor IF-3